MGEIEKCVRVITVGAVMIVGLIYGGLPAVIAEGTIAFVYIIMKNI